MDTKKAGDKREMSRSGKKFVIEGKVRGGIPAELDLSVLAFCGQEILGCAQIKKNGDYKIEFMGEKPVPVEIRILPTKFAKNVRKLPPGVRASFAAGRFVAEKELYRSRYDLLLSKDQLSWFKKVVKTTYRMHGTVYVDNYPQWVQPLPGAKLDFYEVDPGEQYLGTAFSAPDGSYDFEFKFSVSFLLVLLGLAPKPDIRARISQLVDGNWVQVYESPVNWDITADFSKDYFVPFGEYIPAPEPEAKPAAGFRPVSVGLLPIDATRIVKGYATAQAGDPSRIAGIRHQPFCGVLRIFGLFAETPQVVKYKVQLAEADENGPSGDWTDLTDPLSNAKWNDSQKQWDNVGLGPDADNRYQNIDIEPEWDWHEHALKLAWNSANKANGYYALRIIGYNAGGGEVHTEVLQVMRVDNTPPEIAFEAVETSLGPVTDCGHLRIPIIPSSERWIRVRVTAYDPEGHMLRYSISGSRGKLAVSAGATVVVERPASSGTWSGDKNVVKEFLVAALPANLASCPSVAYNLELHAYGSPTDCYAVELSSQHMKKETNLVVAEQ